MAANWPLIIALLLILLKQIYKLHVQHQPNTVDYLKALAALPVDISFLVVSLFVKEATSGSGPTDKLFGLMLGYVIISVFTTVLWRVCDTAVTSRLGGQFAWAFPLNAALAGTTFYLAIQVLG
jgi:hypothetical protein